AARVTPPPAPPPKSGPAPQPPRHAFAGLNVAIAVAPTIAAATRPFRICLMSSPRAYCPSNPTLPFTPDESPGQASNFSTDHGGGKRRASIIAHDLCLMTLFDDVHQMNGCLIVKESIRKPHRVAWALSVTAKEERVMRTLIKAAVALSFIGAAAIGTTATVQAQGVYFDAPGVHVGVGGYPYR